MYCTCRLRLSEPKTKLSRWENGKEQPSEIYRRLFREIYGRTSAELGFPDEPEEDPEAADYAAGSPWPAPSTTTRSIFRHQVDHARHIDRRFGALTQLDQLRTQIDQVQHLLTYRAGPQRPALAGSSWKRPPWPGGKPSTALP